MDVKTARAKLRAAERAATTASQHYNKLVAASSRRRRPDPRIAEAKQARDAAAETWRQAVDDYTRAKERPRYTAPR